jgi:hypothetical protein
MELVLINEKLNVEKVAGFHGFSMLSWQELLRGLIVNAVLRRFVLLVN